MPEFFRIDGFAIEADADITRRDLTRLWSVGFDVLPAGPAVCPPPGVDRFFRIDEFAAAADGALSTRDRTRFTSVGFDLEPTIDCKNILSYTNASGGPAQTVVIVDRDILIEIQLATVEDPVDGGKSFTSGLWTVSEVIDYMNQRQAEFLKLTAILLDRLRLRTIPQVQRHELPLNWIATQRVVFVSPDGRRRVLHRADPFELDHGRDDWQHTSDPRPKVYADGDTPLGIMETAPQHSDNGTLELLYVSMGELLSNTGIPFKVPIDFVPTIKWGVLADMLGKVGRAHDQKRAEYCEQRFQEGVEAAKLVLKGWS